MSIPFRVSSFIVLFGLLLVGACTSHPPTSDFAEITFEHLPDIRLDVDDIEIRARGTALTLEDGDVIFLAGVFDTDGLAFL